MAETDWRRGKGVSEGLNCCFSFASVCLAQHSRIWGPLQNLGQIPRITHKELAEAGLAAQNRVLQVRYVRQSQGAKEVQVLALGDSLLPPCMALSDGGALVTPAHLSDPLISHCVMRWSAVVRQRRRSGCTGGSPPVFRDGGQPGDTPSPDSLHTL